MTRRPASLGRVFGGRVPLLQRYYQGATTACRPSHRTSFPSFGGTIGASVFVSPCQPDAGRRAGGSSVRQPPRRFNASILQRPMETTGSPTFLGNPGVLLPCSTTPAGPSPLAKTTSQGDDAAPVQSTTKAPALRLSRLNHTASALAAYASPGRSPCTTLDSLPVAGQALPDGIDYP